MFLEVDMGNTRIKWRLKGAAGVLARGWLETAATDFNELTSACAVYIRDVKAIWIASVVDKDSERRFADYIQQLFSIEPVFARSVAKICGVKNGYDSPEKLGVDRWLSILAAHHFSKRACVVVSLGTAATADVVDRDGKHIGGFIAPGLSLMIGALTSGARRVSITPAEITAHEALGRSTSLAICGGCTSMLMGLVDNAIKQLGRVVGDEAFDLIFTGGDAVQLMPYYPSAHLINDLVLDGLEYAIGSSLEE